MFPVIRFKHRVWLSRLLELLVYKVNGYSALPADSVILGGNDHVRLPNLPSTGLILACYGNKWHTTWLSSERKL